MPFPFKYLSIALALAVWTSPTVEGSPSK